jgi:hypothetical protein
MRAAGLHTSYWLPFKPNTIMRQRYFGLLPAYSTACNPFDEVWATVKC